MGSQVFSSTLALLRTLQPHILNPGPVQLASTQARPVSLNPGPAQLTSTQAPPS